MGARDLGTGRKQEIAIKTASGLNEAEINRMVEEAEQFADEDEGRREYSQVLNEAEILLYSTEQTIKDYADKFSEGDMDEVKQAMEELNEAKANSDRDLDGLRAATGRLQTLMHKFAELMYSTPDSGDFID